MNVPLGSGAVVMATGIVSIALSLADHRTLSGVFLVLAAAAWVSIAVVIGVRVLRERSKLRAEADGPIALTLVAGTAVLGSRLESGGLRTEAAVLLALSGALWLGLSLILLRRRQLPSAGSSFMLTVAPQSLAALAAAVSMSSRAGWLEWLALGACGIGLALYPLALRRFDPRELRVGAGDHWVVGGALAISALATSEIGLAAGHVGNLHRAVPTIHVISLVIWVAAALWLLVLVASEIVWPRIEYDLRRWSTVFPLGMYSACSFVVGRSAGPRGLVTFANVWVWLSVAGWLVVASARMCRLLSRPRPHDDAGRYAA